MLKKTLSVFGAIALTLGLGMNLQYSLNDYGMGTNSLSTFALAQRPVLPPPLPEVAVGFGV